MKLIRFFLVCLYSVSTVALAENTADMKASLDPQMLEAMNRATTPGEEHALLQRYVGQWNAVVTSWMKPDAPPEVSKGSTRIESVFGGRFIRQSFNGTAMGKPFEGLGFTGYDNLQKHYSSVWLDSIGTGIMFGTGSLDKSKNSIEEHGTFSCPMTPTGMMSYRAVWSPPSNTSFKYEMFATAADGKEYRMMEIVYTKAGA